MKNSVLILAIAALALLAGCTEEPPPSLYDPTYVSGVAPVISSVTPPTNGLALVTVLTITGQNFNPDMTKDIVFFNSTPGLIQTASATQLVVRAPNVVADTVRIKIAVFGSDLFSNTYQYKLEAASLKFGGLGPSDKPYAVTVDGNDNVYASIVVASGGNETGVAVRRFAPDGTPTDFAALGGSGVTSFSGLKWGPGGILFGAANRNVIYQMTGGGTLPTAWVTLGRTEKIGDFDFDAAGNIWGAGGIQKIYRITPAKVTKTFNFFPAITRVVVRSVRLYNNYLYLGGAVDTTEGVWRCPVVSADSLGDPELYFNYSAVPKPSPAAVNAITFATNGDMYMGTTSTEAILIVHPDKSVEALYPGVPLKDTFYFGWGTGPFMYQAQQSATANNLYQINMLAVRSAPYHGR
jgi:hypothetical protein